MNCQVCIRTFDDILMCASCKSFICDSCTSMWKWKCPKCRKQISAKCSTIQDNTNIASSTVDEEARAPQSAGDVLKLILFGVWLCIYASIFLIYVLIPCFSFILTCLYTALSIVVYYVIMVPGSYSAIPVFNAIFPYTLEPLIYFGNVVVRYMVIHPFEFVANWVNKYIWELLLLQIYMYIQEFISLIFLLICFVMGSCFSLAKWIISTPYCLYCERSPGIFIEWDSVGFGVTNVFLFTMHSLRVIFFVLLIPTMFLSLYFLIFILFDCMLLGRKSLKNCKHHLNQMYDFLLYLYKTIFKAFARFYTRVSTELI